MKHNGFEISEEEVKDGDFAINTEYKKAEPMLVKTNKYGILGFEQCGWFDWMPLRKKHKKVIKP